LSFLFLELHKSSQVLTWRFLLISWLYTWNANYKLVNICKSYKKIMFNYNSSDWTQQKFIEHAQVPVMIVVNIHGATTQHLCLQTKSTCIFNILWKGQPKNGLQAHYNKTNETRILNIWNFLYVPTMTICLREGDTCTWEVVNTECLYLHSLDQIKY